MRISEAIARLTDIQNKYGDLEIAGGYMAEDTPLTGIFVVDDTGTERWPEDREMVGSSEDGPFTVFLE